MAPLKTLVRLRWLAVVCQLLLVLATEVTAPGSVPFLPVSVLIAAVAGSNALLATRRDLSDAAAFTVLGLDILGLTGLLALALGPSNPFTALYIVTVAIGTMVLPRGGAAGLVVTAIVAYGALFGVDQPEHHMHGQAMSLHLLGMWFAFAVAAPFVAYAITSLREALRVQEAELESVRQQVFRQERLASLATLATGAAHELATPLGTIAVAARELERHAGPEVAADAALIREEVERCTGILRQLSVSAGHPAGDALRTVSVEELARQACRGLDEGPDVRFELGAESICIPLAPMVRALRGVVDNALDASPDHEPVVLRLGAVGADLVEIVVVDQGGGIPAELVGRIGEPFFTTKGDEGMGLGVFYARSLLEQIGGGLRLEDGPERGTMVTLILPRRCA